MAAAIKGVTMFSRKKADTIFFGAIFLLFSGFLQSVDQSIVLSIQDMNNRPIQQAMIHSPFILQIELNNKDFIEVETPYVAGMDNFKYSPAMRHSHSSTVNGETVKKTIYRFVLKGEKKGTFTVGSVQLKDRRGKSFRSNKLLIKVDDAVVLSDLTEVSKYFVECFINKKSMYVGEIATLHVKFLDRIYVDNPQVVLPEFQHVKIVSIEKKDTTTLEVLNGYDYAVTEWLIKFYPINQGSLLIDGIKVTFLDQRLEEKMLSKGAFRRFGSMIKIAQDMYASPVALQVLGLPEQQGFQNVTAVGQFSKLEVSVNKNVTQEGQGLILSTELIGDGNFEMIAPINLRLPNGLEFYDADTVSIDKDRKSKHAEFVIQAQYPGNYHIVAQKLHYFDPVDHTYKIVQSNSIDITITENIDFKKFQNQSDQHDLCNNETDINKDVKHNVQIDDVGHESFNTRMLVMIPIAWYRLLMFGLLLILLIMMMYRYGFKEYIVTSLYWQHCIIFSRAKKACKVAAYKNNGVVLYSVFINLFIALQVSSAGAIDKVIIEKHLKYKGFSENQIVQWKSFYARLLQASFAQRDQMQNAILFQDSLKWLKLLKEKI